MDKKALQLAARFSLPPNSLGYCGRDTAPQKFNSCIIHGVCDGVGDELEKFIVLHPYLKTISDLTGKSKFDYDVVEAYTIGNNLLEEIQNDGYEKLLDNFLLQGVPDFFVEDLRKDKPKKFIPTHLFQVLHVGVGKASGSVPYNLTSANNCMIRWGKVVEKNEDKIKVTLNSLSGDLHKKNLEIENQDLEFNYNSNFLPNLQAGATVAVHWQQVIKILTKKEIEQLEFWTEAVLSSF